MAATHNLDEARLENRMRAATAVADRLERLIVRLEKWADELEPTPLELVVDNQKRGA